MKNVIKRILSDSLLATKRLEIAHGIWNSNGAPRLLKDFVYSLRNYLPHKKILTKIKLDLDLTAFFELDLNSYIGQEIFYGKFERATLAFYKKILPDKKCVWDIGSNIGFYVVIAGILLKKRGEVFAFEPVPVNFDVLKKNVGLNNLSNIKLFNLALSLEEGEHEIYLLDQDTVTSTPTLNKEWAARSGLNKCIKVPTRNAMSLLSRGELRKPDIIKIDAETYEPIILRSLKPILMDNNAPDIICELMPPNVEPLTKLLVEECCYYCYHILPDRIKAVSELKMRRPYNDYFFTKRNHSEVLGFNY